MIYILTTTVPRDLEPGEYSAVTSFQNIQWDIEGKKTDVVLFSAQGDTIRGELVDFFHLPFDSLLKKDLDNFFLKDISTVPDLADVLRKEWITLDNRQIVTYVKFNIS